MEFCDLVAERGNRHLFVEAKGRTTAPGLDVDTASQSSVRVPLGVVHSEHKHSSESPTSPSPDDHTVGPGADKSSCDAFGWTGQKPSTSPLRKILVPGPARYKVPSGLGIVTATTYVRDPDTEGPEVGRQQLLREPSDRRHDRLPSGRRQFIKVPKNGADDRDALTFGHYGDFAEGLRQKADSIVMLKLGASHGQAAAKLKTLASHLVPKF